MIGILYKDTMMLKRTAAGIASVLCMNMPALAAMNPIQNPADTIHNLADNIYNPATNINNPVSNVYNPATRMNNPDPLSPPTQPVPKAMRTDTAPATTSAIHQPSQPQPQPAVPPKKHYFTTVAEYIKAAKKAFDHGDYGEVISVTEDGLRRIHTGTLVASKKSRQKLVTYNTFGKQHLKNQEMRVSP